ncbi:tryptophan--tRNA ligase [Acidimicrobium ferrooxidans]|uniref:tryptophan--tRNA ligase n=1 Tax=Acidimicrobium ferrooxidans TaxID=53635 RepID=UPI0003056986|nr:tryptophan--tRNA ligase [Acidimicrobium ferrooxidans]
MTQSLRANRVLSGVQPTGVGHLGTLLGAFMNFLADQERAECIFLVADLHSLTVDQDPAALRRQRYELVATFLAVGIDPLKSTIVMQSEVPEHAELAWVMESTATYGELARMTQFKDKSARQTKVRASLFTYPALMAADILLYQADVVPVGEDQLQHLELTRTLAERFNGAYGPTFTVPKGQLPTHAARVMDLAEPTSKMSKSSSSQAGIVFLTDDDATIRRKFLRARTDSFAEVVWKPDDPSRAGVTNLVEILAALEGTDASSVAARFDRYGPLKEAVAEAAVAAIAPVRERFMALRDDEATLRGVLDQGRERARDIARTTMAVVRDRLGLT